MNFRTKLLSLLVAVMAFASLSAVTPAYAVTAEDAILANSDIYTRQDEDFTTTLYITEGAEVCDLQISLNYDPELVTLVSAVSVNDSGTLVINTDTEGAIYVVFSANNNIDYKMGLVDLTFHVDENAGIGAYDCLTVNSSYDNEAHRLDDSTGAFNEVELTTSFTSLVLYEMGDVNLDQKVSVQDVSLLKRHLTYLPTTPVLTDFHLRIADAEKDDEVNMRDVARIMRRCAYYLDDIYGDRINIYFYDANGDQYAVKSVLYGSDLNKLPAVPTLENYGAGQWSASADKYVEPDLTGIVKELKLYAVYGEYQSEAIAYYKQKLTETYYSGDLPTGLSGDLNLVTTLNYQSGYYAEISWQSSSNYILNNTTGKFNKPTYPTELTLRAAIVSYDANNAIEAQDSIAFVYQVPGLFDTPAKSEIVSWIEKFFTDDDGCYRVNYNLKLPQKVTDEEVAGSSGDNYEVRINWSYLDANGNELPITQISRTTSAQELDLIATITFNGKPLEDDGRVYLDDVQITAIDQIEVKNYIVEQIAANVSTTLSDGCALWADDTKYGTTIQWVSAQQDTATISNNVVSIDKSAVNGALLPIKAVVTYVADGKQQEFTLSYTTSVVTENTLLEPGTNIDQNLYNALKDELFEATGFTGNLTTVALRDQSFVSLDLSGHPEITSLQGLAYCTNLHALNISGLKLVDSSINEIASLSKLEALIAKDCGLDNLSDGGKAVLSNTINLKLLDLSDNYFTSLDSVLNPDVTYGQLREVYLANNQLEDISALSRAPAMTYLSIANNGLTTEDIDQLANFPYLNYLSLADNEIDDISVLQTLTNLVELRLQNNRLTDVSALRKLTNLQALYLGHNSIKSGVEFLKTLTKLEVLYLNDNQITSISSLSTLTKLKAINVTNNPSLNDLSVLSNCKTTIEEIYAENDSMTSFNFIEGMSNLRVLMLAGNAPEDATASDFLTSQLSGLTNMEVLTLSDKPLKDLNFLAYMPKLVRLDVANCSLSAYTSDGASNITSIVNLYSTLKTLNISDNDFSGYETELLNLRNLSNLVIFYADNICDAIDISALVNEMPQLRYISLENCGVSDLSWMAKKHYLVYVDLADNNIANVDLSAQTTDNNRETLQYLYLDTNVPATFATFYEVGIDNVLKELSLKGISILSVSYLPNMEQLTYLNLADTGLTSLQGDDPDFYDVYSIERFKTLKTLDVTGLQVELAPVLNLPNLRTLYAVAEPADLMFYKSNLHTLQSLYNKSVTGYLYDNNTVYAPVAQTEGTAILNLIEDFSCEVTVAADGMISDNNPELPAEINDYEIDWTISNESNYEIVDNHLAVKSYENIEDETLTLTAAIRVYDDQEIVTRDFTIDVSILRPSADTRALYYLVDTTGFGEELQRNDVFAYDIDLQAGVTDGFSEQVKPVTDEIVYSYSSVLASGSSTPYPNIIEEQSEHNYLVLESAPLDSVTTITVKMIHYVDGEAIVDDTITASFTVLERTYTITYEANGGVVTDANGLTVTSQSKGEESLLFEDITVTRTGYLFDGWYADEALTELYWAEGDAPMYMPADNLTVYAKWTPHSFYLNFDANGGTVSETSRLILCDTPFGELPVPSRDGFEFVGWFTADGTEITAETSMATAEDVTVYAEWSIIPYTVSWETGTGYSIAVSRTSSPNADAEIGDLSNGETVYYGDELSITYTASTGYSLTSHGDTSVTVTGNVTSSSIKAEADANSYTYKIVYISSNKTDLGSAEVTYKYGTTNTISAPAKSGYTTPDPQTVIWDSTTAKTITFTYTPIPVSTSQAMSSGNWYIWDGKYGITYSASAEYQNRTATSIQIRVKWTNTITANTWYGYAQYFTANIGGTSSGEITIVTSSTWSANSSSSRSATVYTGWITVPVSATQTSVSISATYRDLNSKSGSWSKTMTIPTY